jgi:hypothetical protein
MFFSFFLGGGRGGQDWGLKSGLCILAVGPHPVFFALVIFQIGSHAFAGVSLRYASHMVGITCASPFLLILHKLKKSTCHTLALKEDKNSRS